MRRNCNLTLRLVPPSSHDHHHRRQDQEQPPNEEVDLLGLDPNQNLNENENQQLTIFYDGKISVCDVTDFQAKAIIKLASEEREEKWRNRTPSESSSPLMMLSPSPSPSPSPSNGGLSMKKSLQRFLQKRKHRLQATSPYHH